MLSKIIKILSNVILFFLIIGAIFGLPCYFILSILYFLGLNFINANILLIVLSTNFICLIICFVISEIYVQRKM